MPHKFSILILSAMVMRSVSYRIKDRNALEAAEKDKASRKERHAATSNPTVLSSAFHCFNTTEPPGDCAIGDGQQNYTLREYHQVSKNETEGGNLEDCAKRCKDDESCDMFEFRKSPQQILHRRLHSPALCRLFFHTSVLFESGNKFLIDNPGSRYKCYWWICSDE
eukprot:TRINITY_DN64138_c0_g1_i1.p1 TRINITY_DN64138_c0_g1~~TRINITY_DN64138_c0_g1_i1.p1  ORF type:complete len:166 (+),score=18.57 TRINITY_DN64138_c0_g1_i1:170-667(+)